MSFTVEEIKEIIDYLEKKTLDEIEIEQDNFKVRVKKYRNDGTMVNAMTLPMTMPYVPSAPSLETQVPEKVEKLVEVKAPMAGIFYVAPKPGAEPFVKVGQQVKQGEIVGLIEAMKIINDVEAPCDGVIKEICVENEQFSEFHSVLMKIEEK